MADEDSVDDGADGLTTPCGLKYVREDHRDDFTDWLYELDLGGCEKLYRSTSNPLYVWEALRKFGKLWQNHPHLCLPAWCLEYLINGSVRLDTLQNVSPVQAVKLIPKALGLKAGQGANYFRRKSADEKAVDVGKRYEDLRKKMTAQAAEEAIGTEMAERASARVKARLEMDGNSSLSERSVRRRLAKARQLGVGLKREGKGKPRVTP